MKTKRSRLITTRLRNRSGALLLLTSVSLAIAPQSAHASLFHGETLDSIANGLAWIILFLVPIVGIAVFWLVHILPEKVAEKKNHPQAKAIHCLCLLSLFFGGLLWPLAWLWAYSKPVFHKMAYGTDVGDSHDHADGEPVDETERLRQRVADLESELARKGAI